MSPRKTKHAAVFALVAVNLVANAARADESPSPSSPQPTEKKDDPTPKEAAAPALTPQPESGAPQGSPTAPASEFDHRFEGSLLIGAMLPGEISPVNWFHTEAHAAPTFGYDGGYLLHKHFVLGAYLQVTPLSFDRMSGSKSIGTGDGFWLSGGASLKGRLPLSDVFILHGGLTAGLNVVSYDGTGNNGAFELSGRGLNVGLITDALWRASQKVGAAVQLSFLSQPLGNADVAGYPTGITAEGGSRKFGFSPIIFLTAGPTLFL